MKKTVLALVVAAATGVALSAQAPAQTASSKAPAVKQTATKTAPAKSTGEKKEMKSASTKAKAHVETAEVVSADATAKSITVKPKDGDNRTYTATGAAVAQLAKLKAGEEVRLTVRDNDVTRISPAHAAKRASKKSATKKTETK